MAIYQQLRTAILLRLGESSEECVRIVDRITRPSF